METWRMRTERRLRRSVSGGLRSEAPWSRSWGSSTATLQRRSGKSETSKLSGTAARSSTGISSHARWTAFFFFLNNIKTGLNSCCCHLAGKIMRSPWWFVSACPNVRRMPGKEERCPCPASWVASHTLVTSRRWREGRGQRWASSDVTKLGLPAWCQTGRSGPLRLQRVVCIEMRSTLFIDLILYCILAGWNFTAQEKEESHEEEYQKER